jgi:4-amino-4-deoxy-L-arabinose transferase-like glycosyltransferase
MKIKRQSANFIAAGLLFLMFGLAFSTLQYESLTMDELAHTPAGYSYITQQDMRLNPEHPPLLKDAAGMSVWLGEKFTGRTIVFPTEHQSWQTDLNGQWDFGRELLYRSGNDADQMIFWSRLPMLLLMLLLGFYVFKWARELYGNKAGLIALFLYSLSPTFIAHGRLVTTDVGAAAAFFIAAYYLIKWLKEPSKKNLIIAGLVLGLALLTKFSLALIIPYFIFLVIVWIVSAVIKGSPKNNVLAHKNIILRTVLGLFLIGLIAMALVWPVYLFHTWEYPVEKQLSDAQTNLQTFGKRWLADPVIWLSDKPLLRPYGQFFLGLLMVIQRAAGGNTTYFLGEISKIAWLHYFPVVFLIKVPLPLLILALIALGSIFGITLRKNKKSKRLFVCILSFVKKYFTEIAMLAFLAIYWITSIRSNLNIGVRHILPTFPFLYVLISGQIAKWLRPPIGPVLEKIKVNSTGVIKSTRMILSFYSQTAIKAFLIIILLGWYAYSAILIYPHFIAYFNESVGGPSQGYKYVTDSNLDWGQDLKRLTEFCEEKNISTIYVDYFGGDSLEYRLEDKFRPWWGERDPDELPPNSWLAVSATMLQGGRGMPDAEYNEKTGYYNWLNQYEPVTVIGHSIFVYHL